MSIHPTITHLFSVVLGAYCVTIRLRIACQFTNFFACDESCVLTCLLFSFFLFPTNECMRTATQLALDGFNNHGATSQSLNLSAIDRGYVDNSLHFCDMYTRDATNIVAKVLER